MASDSHSNQIPAFVYASSDELNLMLESAGFKDKTDHMIFTQICDQVHSSRENNIKLDDFMVQFLRWADRNNFSRFRHVQNVNRQVYRLLKTLSDKGFCEITFDGDEIKTITLTDPAIAAVNKLYETSVSQGSTSYPTLESLNFEIPNSMLTQIVINELNEDALKQAMTNAKVIRIQFLAPSSHILITPENIPNLLRICKAKMRHYLHPGTKTKMLDDLVRDLQSILPEKTINADRLLRILASQENEDTLFMVHLTSRFISQLQNETHPEKTLTYLQSAQILEQFKVSEEAKEKEQQKEDRQRRDMLKLLDIAADLGQPFTREDMTSLREGYHYKAGGFDHFSEHYSEAEFAELVERLTQKYSKFEDGSSTDDERLLPTLVELQSETQFLYIHRRSLVNFFEEERKKTADIIRGRILVTWTNELQNSRQTSSMQFDPTFEKLIEKSIEKEHPDFKALLMQPQLIYNAFFIKDSMHPRALNVNMFFVPSEKPVFKPYHSLLGLNRRELFKQAYSRLPFTKRFFLFKFFFTLLNMFRGGSKGSDDIDLSESSSSSGQHVTGAALKEALTKLESKYAGGKKSTMAMTEYENRWNIKLGPVRRTFKSDIDELIATRTRKLVTMARKNKAYSVSGYQKDLVNIADSMAKQYDKEVRSHQAFKDYVVLKGLEIIKNNIR